MLCITRQPYDSTRVDYLRSDEEFLFVNSKPSHYAPRIPTSPARHSTIVGVPKPILNPPVDKSRVAFTVVPSKATPKRPTPRPNAHCSHTSLQHARHCDALIVPSIIRLLSESGSFVDQIDQLIFRKREHAARRFSSRALIRSYKTVSFKIDEPIHIIGESGISQGPSSLLHRWGTG
jgi:hypothetical protein